jgi:hypothetical protein
LSLYDLIINNWCHGRDILIQNYRNKYPRKGKADCLHILIKTKEGPGDEP